jgi:hypothetical protein
MNEKDLIAALGGLDRPDLAARKPAPGVIKCLTESCPVYLTVDCGRDYCRWCARKRLEEITLNAGDRGRLGGHTAPLQGTVRAVGPIHGREHVS